MKTPFYTNAACNVIPVLPKPLWKAGGGPPPWAGTEDEQALRRVVQFLASPVVSLA